MNKVYAFTIRDGDDVGYLHFGAQTWREAREMARGSWLNGHADEFTDYNGHIVKREGRPITTEYTGELDLNQMKELGILWFECDDCANSDLLQFDEHFENYTCGECGTTARVPYANI